MARPKAKDPTTKAEEKLKAQRFREKRQKILDEANRRRHLEGLARREQKKQEAEEQKAMEAAEKIEEEARRRIRQEYLANMAGVTALDTQASAESPYLLGDAEKLGSVEKARLKFEKAVLLTEKEIYEAIAFQRIKAELDKVENMQRPEGPDEAEFESTVNFDKVVAYAAAMTDAMKGKGIKTLQRVKKARREQIRMAREKAIQKELAEGRMLYTYSFKMLVAEKLVKEVEFKSHKPLSPYCLARELKQAFRVRKAHQGAAISNVALYTVRGTNIKLLAEATNYNHFWNLEGLVDEELVIKNKGRLPSQLKQKGTDDDY